MVLEIFVGLVGVGRTEEVCGRQLLRIANDNRLPSPSDRADRIPRGDLRGFVEYDDVELRVIHREILRDRERRHQHAGCQLRECLRHVGDHLPNRPIGAFQAQLMAEHPQFRLARHLIHGG